MFTKFAALLSYIPFIGSFLKIESDVENDIKNPSEENLNASVTDIAALAEKMFPNVAPARIEAGSTIGLTLITLESNRGLNAIEADVAVIAHQLPVLLACPNSTQAKIDNLTAALLAFESE